MAKKIALVLVDVLSHGLKAGQLVEADEKVIAALQGQVDPHKDAVAHARSQGAAVVKWSAGEAESEDPPPPPPPPPPPAP